MYQNSKQHKENFKKARLKALEIKLICKYCSITRTKANIVRHENSCYLNPINKKLCPICSKPIKHYRHNTVCGHSCSNKHFRTGPNHGNWKESAYVSTCFHYHKKECVICKEHRVVEVHHLDENHNNNSPDNLIPLCPTHHKYWHSRHKHLIEQQVLQYIKFWSGTRESNPPCNLPRVTDDTASSSLI